MDVINKHDIYLQSYVETHATHDAELNICNFKHFIKCRDKSGNQRTFGGLSVYVTEDVSYVPTENKNVIWCKLHRTFFDF